MKSMSKVLRAPVEMLTGRIGRFRNSEDGGMIFFSLILFVLILAFGGMAVDLMRFETTRAKLQGTLDRATLAAADLDQTETAEYIVNDYFAKAGMLQYLDSVTVDEGINYRVVTANASVEIPLFFYDLPRTMMAPFDNGLTALTVSGVSSAEERVTDVEVSLVLDVSGSMNSNSRIQNLRPAARDFVSTVLANNTNAPEGLITISMVPYSAVVNPGTDLVPFLTGLNRSHYYSACPLFDDDEFTTTELDLSASYDHVAHFDPDWYSADAEPIGNPWCHVGDHNSIVPHSTDEGLLHDAIDDLQPYGNTAIDMGMKWGVALLDPSTRVAITALAATPNNSVPAMASGRPEDLGRSDVLKIVVLMTDGSNTQQYDLRERFKTGMSYIWFDLNSSSQALQEVNRNYISVQYAGLTTPLDYSDDHFYISHSYTSQRWRDYPRGFSSNAQYAAAMNAGPVVTGSPGSGNRYQDDIHQASWQELYATWEHNRVNNDLLSRARSDGAIPSSAGWSWWQNPQGDWEQIYHADYNDADSAIDYGIVNGSEADDRLSDMCQTARDEGVIIYTVAFEAPSGGRNALLDCATSELHYFDVSGTDIADAFSAIASDIRALKLTE